MVYQMAVSSFRILAMRPTPSTWPATMCPPKRPLAGMARSRLTALPTVSCASAERFKVSCMTSAAKLSGKSCLTVRQMPLTAMLSPILVSSRTVFARTVSTAECCPRFDGFYCSDFFHDSGKHGYSTSLSIRKIFAKLFQSAVLQAECSIREAEHLHPQWVLWHPFLRTASGQCKPVPAARCRFPVQTSSRFRRLPAECCRSAPVPAVPSAAEDSHDRNAFFQTKDPAPGLLICRLLLRVAAAGRKNGRNLFGGHDHL